MTQYPTMVLNNDKRDAGRITQKAIIVRVVLSNGTHDTKRRPPIYSGVSITLTVVLCMFCRSLFVFLSFFLWPLCCLSFFEYTNVYYPFNIIKLFLSQILILKTTQLIY